MQLFLERAFGGFHSTTTVVIVSRHGVAGDFFPSSATCYRLMNRTDLYSDNESNYNDLYHTFHREDPYST